MIRGYHVGSDTMTPYELALVDLMENLEAHYTEALARIESLERDLSIEREIAGEVALEALARITDLEKERDQYKVEFDATTDAVTVHIIQQRDAALSRIKVLEQELDAAQTLAADYCANTEDALSQRDDARERYVALEGELLGCQDATQALRAENARLVSGAFDLNLQLAELREQVEVGAKMLAHQCDLAREAETRAAHAFGCERDAQDECIALEAQLAVVTRELEKMKLEKQKLSDIVMTVCDERDAAQVRQEAKLMAVTQERNTLMGRWKTHSCALDTIVQELRERIKVLTKELDAAQTLAQDYQQNTEDALNQRDKALRMAGDNADAGKKLMDKYDAALARVKALEEVGMGLADVIDHLFYADAVSDDLHYWVATEWRTLFPL